MKRECSKCGTCCGHVIVEIDEPTTKEDIDEMHWWLLHKNVSVFIDKDDDSWNVEFKTPCKELKEDNLCGTYETRPEVCKDYSADECTNNDDCEDMEYITFTTREELDKYLKETNWQPSEEEEDDDEEDSDKESSEE